MKHLGDITKINGYEIPIVDCICGGSPCQDLSVAGKRAGLAGERSGLFMEQMRIVREMRENDRRKNNRKSNESVRPRFLVWENVPGALSSGNPAGEDFRIVLEEVARVADSNAVIPGPPDRWTNAGVIVGNGWSIAWRIHDSQFWGVAQRRRRLSLVADFGSESVAEILFERKGLSRDIETSEEAGETVAGTVGRSIDKAISFQERAGKPGGGKGILIQHERTGALSTLNNQSVIYGICATNSNSMKSSNPHSGIYKANTSRTLDLNGGNPNCNQGGMICLQRRFSSVNVSEDGTTPTLEAGAGEGGNNMPIVLEGNGQRDSHKGDGYKVSETMYTLNTVEQHGVVYSMGHDIRSAKFTGDEITDPLTASDYKDPIKINDCRKTYQDITDTLDCGITKGAGNQLANSDMFIANTFVVRRLTPLECERLQGFPDGWTDIGSWTDTKGKVHKESSDTARYKALGNSIAVGYANEQKGFWIWLMKRISERYDRVATLGSLFDGIGGFPLAWEYCNGKGTAIWASEIEEFPIAVTKYHFPEGSEIDV